MSSEPLVSVILSVYRDRGKLEKSIESVLCQTWQRIELIVINDASPDQVSKTVRSIQTDDDRVILIENDDNLGLTRSLNRGLGIAKGRYIARIDEGDIWHKDKLDCQIRFLEEQKEYVMVGSRYTTYSDSGEPRQATVLPIGNRAIKRWLFSGLNPMLHSAIVFRNLGFLYNEDAVTSQDFELYLRLFFVGKIYNIPNSLVEFQIDSNSISSERKDDQFFNHLHMHRKFLEILSSQEASEFVRDGVDFDDRPFALQARKKYMKFIYKKLGNSRLTKRSQKILSNFLVPDILVYTLYKKIFLPLGKRNSFNSWIRKV